MHPQDAPFDLTAFLESVRQAVSALVCNIGFEAAVHGLFFALGLGILGVIFKVRKGRFGKPLLSVAKKLTIFCIVLASPGAVVLFSSGQLPPSGALQITSLGFVVFWSLISLHLSAEEVNHQWF